MAALKIGSLCALAALTLASVACGGGAGSPVAPEAVPTPPPSPKVAIISIDGLRPDALTATGVEASNILGLAGRSAYTWTGETVSPSETLPAHSSMVSGQLPTVHKMLWDDYDPRKGTITVPTVFTIAKAAGLRTVMVASKTKFQHLNVAGSIDSFVLATQNDAEVANYAAVQVQAGFDLMLVHFSGPDLTGHDKGWMSPAYAAAVSETDRAVGRLLASLPRETTIILTADHGGSGNNHAMRTPQNYLIPWMVAGPKVMPHQIAVLVRPMDTAATALSVFGLALPQGAAGTVVSEAFQR